MPEDFGAYRPSHVAMGRASRETFDVARRCHPSRLLEDMKASKCMLPCSNLRPNLGRPASTLSASWVSHLRRDRWQALPNALRELFEAHVGVGMHRVWAAL